jgi:hypothetical protein
MRSPLRLGPVAALVLAALTLLPSVRADDDPRVLRVLWVGNSYTRFNNLPRMVERIARSVVGGPRVRGDRQVRGGYSLRLHWRRREARRLIDRGRYDAVVLQGHSMEAITHPDEMADYARRFHRRVHSTGARLVLFETWARHPESRLYTAVETVEDAIDMEEQVRAVYADLADELGAEVAPVGRAWQRAASTLPRLRLYRDDGTHPDVPGTYLSACVLYGTVVGRDPRAARWAPWGLDPTEASRLRDVAAATLETRLAEQLAAR